MKAIQRIWTYVETYYWFISTLQGVRTILEIPKSIGFIPHLSFEKFSKINPKIYWKDAEIRPLKVSMPVKGLDLLFLRWEPPQ